LRIAHDLKPKVKLEFTIPAEAQQVALETLIEFARNTKLEHLYQMLPGSSSFQVKNPVP